MNHQPGIGISMNHQPGIGISMNVQSGTGIGMVVLVEHSETLGLLERPPEATTIKVYYVLNLDTGLF